MDDRKAQILLLTKSYYNKNFQSKPYNTGDKINYGGRVFNEEELCNLVEASLDMWLTNGRFVKSFEEDLAKFLNVKFCSLVNSGSSANLLAFYALTSSELGDRQIKRGDEVITVACCFPTTVAPILQYGAVPVFVDIKIPSYNIDISLIESAISKKTKAIFIAHTLGNPFNIKVIKEICERHNLWLIEDNCDALGSRYKLGENWSYTGTFGDLATSSFYPPHHITTGEGGAVYTNNQLLHKLIRSYRDWGRDCICASGVDNSCGARFSGKFGDLPLGYDHKYVYSHLGFNLKATEFAGALGATQLKKLPSFIEKRKRNWCYLKDALEAYSKWLILPEAEKNSDPSWFGFALTAKDQGLRDTLVAHLEKNGIQTRMLFAGNIIKHPCFSELTEGLDYKVVSKLTNTDIVLNNTFWLGCYPGLDKERLDYIIQKIKCFFE